MVKLFARELFVLGSDLLLSLQHLCKCQGHAIMLSSRNIQIPSHSSKPKSYNKYLYKTRFSGQFMRTGHVAGCNALIRKSPTEGAAAGRRSMSGMNRNPCLRRMRELHTVEIRNKRTKELVDLEVSVVVVVALVDAPTYCNVVKPVLRVTLYIHHESSQDGYYKASSLVQPTH